MIIDLTPLKSGIKNEIIIDENISFDEKIKETELLDIKNTKVSGKIYIDSLDEYIINLKINGTMILPCSRTLKPTEYKFTSEIDENLEEITENFKKNQKTIDILPIIWENILMEIPIRIINPKADEIKLKGDGWELITDSEE